MKKQLLLISSSRCQNGEFLHHCSGAIKEFLGSMAKDEKVAFIPYAHKDHDGYAAMASAVFANMGYNLESVHAHKDPKELLADPKVKAVFVGGGNTFRLLNDLHKKGIFSIIKNSVENKDLKYIGSSAGTIMACPTIKTTNDMPIVLPPNFDALGFISFQINPHFISGNLVPGHMGETRETRIKEYHEENSTAVVGLTETNWVTVNGENIILHGEKDAFIFERGKELKMWRTGTELFSAKML